MEDGILCDNCESVLAAVRRTTEFPGCHEFDLCLGCSEAYDEFASKNYDIPMVMTREWLSLINPCFMDSSQLFVRVVALLRAIFPEVSSDNWRLTSLTDKGFGTIALRIDPAISIRLVMGEKATSVMIVIENSDIQLGVVGSVNRRVIRNESWIDFFSWINNARTWYDRRNKENIDRALQQGGLVGIGELSPPLTWG